MFLNLWIVDNFQRLQFVTDGPTFGQQDINYTDLIHLDFVNLTLFWYSDVVFVF